MIEIWNYFKQNGFTDEGAAAMLGNLYVESKLNPKNLQDSFNKSLNMSDEEYTKQVDNNIYKNFIYDKAGYGLAQWTHESRKQNFYKYIKSKNKSIGDLNAQLEFLLKELKEEYSKVYNKLKTSSNVSELSDCVMLDYERPADKSEPAKQKRRKSSENFYNQYTGGKNTMKYSKTNPPLACIMDNSTCYKGTSTMSVKGILWHSTGVNNPDLKRYVQPSEHDPNYHPLMAKLGKNAYGNDWNHETVQAGVNAWIGKLADGTIASVQTLPWNYKPWGCASGSRGSCNNGWIQFEICEDRLDDKKYFEKVYKEACELTAYLCKMYNLDPKGTVNMNGIKVPVILCHSDSYKLGFGNNHGDILHWFSKYGKTMKDIRNDIAQIINNSPEAEVILPEEEEMTQEQFNIMMNNWIAEQAKKPASDWSKEFRDWGEKNNLVSGDTNGDMMYKKFLTREEFITVLYRALHRNIMD